MDNCGQACPYSTLDGCKVKEYKAICPLTNMATPVTEYKMTNAQKIRAMSDEELAMMFSESCEYRQYCFGCPAADVVPKSEVVRLQSQIKRLKKYDEERDIALHARLITETREKVAREIFERLHAHRKYDGHTVSVRLNDLVRIAKEYGIDLP